MVLSGWWEASNDSVSVATVSEQHQGTIFKRFYREDAVHDVDEMCIRDRATNSPFSIERVTPSKALVMFGSAPVSYTHLDVYKRQGYDRAFLCWHSVFIKLNRISD